MQPVKTTVLVRPPPRMRFKNPQANQATMAQVLIRKMTMTVFMFQFRDLGEAFAVNIGIKLGPRFVIVTITSRLE
jgi:hypothetical protein